jgi:glycosyltransferase involved in cell wall biosynthesis
VSEPSLSVVIATRDRAPFVARCLDALAAQDAAVDEIIVVDQSGDDGTRRACAAHGPRVRHVADPGRGQSRGRNRGVALASGELIACLDDDCYAHPDWARAVRDVMARHPDAAGAFGEMLGGAGAPPGAAGLEVSTIGFPAEIVHRRRCPPHHVGFGGNFVLRRETWRSLGPRPCDESLDPGSPNPGCSTPARCSCRRRRCAPSTTSGGRPARWSARCGGTVAAPGPTSASTSSPAIPTPSPCSSASSERTRSCRRAGSAAGRCYASSRAVPG